MNYKPQRDCLFCDIKIPAKDTPQENKVIFQWHLAGHPENMPEKKERLVKHAGKWHLASCRFPAVDQAVCNCPKRLKPTEPKAEDWQPQSFESKLMAALVDCEKGNEEAFVVFPKLTMALRQTLAEQREAFKKAVLDIINTMVVQDPDEWSAEALDDLKTRIENL